MTFVPRDYQVQARVDALDKFEKYQRLLGVMGTGMGKTKTAGYLANDFKNLGRILWLTHEGELLRQSQQALEELTGLHSQIEKADQWADARTFGSGLLFGSIQTMVAGSYGGRMTRFNPKDFSLMVVDEGHHSCAPTWKRTIDYFCQNPDLKCLLLTATPDRADEEALGQIVQEVAFEYNSLYGRDNGWLVGVEVVPCFVHSLDMSEMRVTAGELNGADLAANLEQDRTVLEMRDAILEKCGDEKTLVFTHTVDQSRRLTAYLNDRKPGSAEYVCGTTPDEYRGPLLARHKAGEYQYLLNVGITIEGYDDPNLMWVVMGRPHLSRSPVAQKLGRGMRPLAGVVDGLTDPVARIRAILSSAKPRLQVLDFYGTSRFSLIHPADVLGGKYPDEREFDDIPTVTELANENIERAGKPADIASELVKAEREIDRRLRERRELERRAKVYRNVKSVYTFGKSIDPFEALDIIPCREPVWHKGRLATDGQRAALSKFGVNAPENLSFVHASQAMDALIKRAQEGKPSLKMAKLLKRFGYKPDEMSFQQAKMEIDKLAANGWKRVKQKITA